MLVYSTTLAIYIEREVTPHIGCVLFTYLFTRYQTRLDPDFLPLPPLSIAATLARLTRRTFAHDSLTMRPPPRSLSPSLATHRLP